MPLCRLNNDLKVKEKQNTILDEEAATLRNTILAKDRALARSKAEADTAKEKLTQAEGRSGKGVTQRVPGLRRVGLQQIVML